MSDSTRVPAAVAENFWRAQLAGLAEPGCFPTDYLPAAASGMPVEATVRFDTMLAWHDLADGDLREMNAVMTAAAIALLTLYTRNEEIVLGQPTMLGGSADNVEIVLRCQVARADTFRELVARVRALSAEANRHADHSLGSLAMELVGRRHFYDVAVIMDGLHDPRFRAEVRVPVLFTVAGGEVRLAGDGRFTSQTLQRILKHYVALLIQVSADPDLALSDVTLLTDDDVRLLERTSDTAVAHDSRVRIEQRLEQQAQATPDAVAVVGDGVRLTYAELDSRVNRLARHLRSRGVGCGDRVAVVAERSPGMLIAIFATLRAGGAYVPVDPDYPPDRISYLLTDSAVKAVLTQPRFMARISEVADVVDIESDESYDDSDGPLEPDGDARDLAYVIYTSGTTGNPNGVMVEHHSVINRLDWMQRCYPIGPADVVMQKTPISFDVSVWELFLWACQGAAVCLLEPGGHKDPGIIVDTIQRHHVTAIHFVPSMLSMFLEYVELMDAGDQVTSLRRVFASGEALRTHQVRTFRELCTAELINLYGPTEATVDVSHHICDNAGVGPTVPIGVPIDNIRIYIVDERLRIQPIGVPGELVIAGVGLARGYLDRPTLTEEKFVSPPFEGEERVYRTGDMARLLDDGTFEFMGRLDHQVKIRGIRVELEEVAASLRGHPAVKDAVVTAGAGRSAQTSLRGYVVLREPADENELKRYAAARLPEFMVPTRIMALPELPLLPNGKLDRRSLPTS